MTSPEFAIANGTAEGSGQLHPVGNTSVSGSAPATDWACTKDNRD
ncbi:hypothetical protein [Melaminivora sp.]